MPALVRRYWWVAALQIGLVIALAAWFATRIVEPKAIAAGTGPVAPTGGNQTGNGQALDALTYSRVFTLRKELALTNEDLAGIGCTQISASQVLTAAVGWCQLNKTAWDQAESALHTARSAYRNTIRLVNVGSSASSTNEVLAAAKQAEDTAESQWTQFLDAAAATVQVGLSSAQTSQLATLRGNHLQPVRYRPLQGLPAATSKALAVGISKYGENSNQVQQLESNLLDAGSKSLITATENQREQSMNGILLAENSSLPLPDALKVTRTTSGAPPTPPRAP